MVEVPSRGYQPIENYGVIGDLYTVALVGMCSDLITSAARLDYSTAWGCCLNCSVWLSDSNCAILVVKDL